MQVRNETLVRNGAKAAQPKTRPLAALFTYKPLKVRTQLKAGLKYVM